MRRTVTISFNIEDGTKAGNKTVARRLEAALNSDYWFGFKNLELAIIDALEPGIIVESLTPGVPIGIAISSRCSVTVERTAKCPKPTT